MMERVMSNAMPLFPTYPTRCPKAFEEWRLSSADPNSDSEFGEALEQTIVRTDRIMSRYCGTKTELIWYYIRYRDMVRIKSPVANTFQDDLSDLGHCLDLTRM